jgi:glutathione synthase
MRIGIAITHAGSVDGTWTTVHLARVALQRGHSVRFVEPWDYEVDSRGQLVARAYAFDPPASVHPLMSADEMAAALSHRTARRCFVDLGQLDLLLLRAAPLDAAVLTFAALAQDRGVRVVNDPNGVVRVSHKAWLATIPGVRTPPTLVTGSLGAAQVFYSEQRDGVIVKPARGSGGRGVSWVPPRRHDQLDEAFEAARVRGDGYVVVQGYLPEAEEGEKRIVWLDGAVLGGYLRRRAPGDFRHNLKRGGVAEAVDITEQDRKGIAPIGPALLQAGIRIAGIDLIGGYVTEVNALNPGGAFHTDRLAGTHLAETIIARLEDPGPRQETDAWALPVP